jgi:hypothetical protein
MSMSQSYCENCLQNVRHCAWHILKYLVVFTLLLLLSLWLLSLHFRERQRQGQERCTL